MMAIGNTIPTVYWLKLTQCSDIDAQKNIVLTILHHVKLVLVADQATNIVNKIALKTLAFLRGFWLASIGWSPLFLC